MNSFYDDKKFSYLEYWTTRDYEHQSELVALEKLMGRAKFNTVVDFGGGYGRLSKWLASRVTRVMLIEPADKQRRLAKQFLKGVTNVEILEGNDTKTGLQSGCADLVVAVRVVHHLGDTRGLFTELHRLAKPDGKVIVEFANSLNFKSRLRSILLNVPISKSPIDMRSAQNRNDTTIAFLKKLWLCHFCFERYAYQ
jgi:SAM-dependent methyltransferase